MTETKLLRAQSPTDLLACVPTLLGFHPQRSLVMITCGPARVPVHARVDLPVRDAPHPDDPGDPDDPVAPDDAVGPDHLGPVEDEVAADLAVISEDLAGVAHRSGVSAVAVVLYTDDEGLADAAGRAIARRLDELEVHLQLVVRADGEQWWLHRLDGSAVRGPGTPYELTLHPLTVEATLDGRVVHRDRDALRASLGPADPGTVARVEREAQGWADLFVASRQSPHGPDRQDERRARAHLVAEGRWVQERVRAFHADRCRLDATDTARLLVALLSIEVRDVAWAEIRHESARVHVDLWRDVVRHAPRELLAAPAALLAFAAWIAGDGALAWCAVDRCHEADPDYSLAGLVTHALSAAVPPRAWQPLDESALSLFAG